MVCWGIGAVCAVAGEAEGSKNRAKRLPLPEGVAGSDTLTAKLSLRTLALA